MVVRRFLLWLGNSRLQEWYNSFHSTFEYLQNRTTKNSDLFQAWKQFCPGCDHEEQYQGTHKQQGVCTGMERLAIVGTTSGSVLKL